MRSALAGRGGRVLLALVTTVAAATAIAALGSDTADDWFGLPDLDQRAPDALVITQRGDRFLLAFSSRVENIGGGPLVISAGRPSTSTATMTADQVVRRADGFENQVSGVGQLRYVRSPDHSHWHYLGFDRYELRDPGGTSIVADRKTGFCLGDRYRIGAGLATSSVAEWEEECGRDQPELLTVEEGISPGFGDDYPARLEGQYIDLTGVPSGEYLLVHEVNANRRLEELDYANNTASAAVEITWPRARARAPRLELISQCEDGLCGRG